MTKEQALADLRAESERVLAEMQQRMRAAHTDGERLAVTAEAVTYAATLKASADAIRAHPGWSEADNSMRIAIVIGDPPQHIRDAGNAIDALHAEPLATANLLRLIADEMPNLTVESLEKK